MRARPSREEQNAFFQVLFTNQFFVPLLSVAIKGVAKFDENQDAADLAGHWQEKNAETEEVETHGYFLPLDTFLDAKNADDPNFEFLPSSIAGRHFKITVHFRRITDKHWPRIAADRVSAEKPFGFSLEASAKYPSGQNFLNLVFRSDVKTDEFEPLFLKVEVSKDQFVYLRVEIKESSSTVDYPLAVIVSVQKIEKEEAPKRLQLLFSEKEVEQNALKLLRQGKIKV